MSNNPVFEVFEPIVPIRAPALQIATFWGLPISACSISGQVSGGQPAARTGVLKASPEELDRGGEGQLPTSRLRPNRVISASNCRALSAKARRQRRAPHKKNAT